MNTNQGALYFGAGIDLNQWRRDVDSMRRDIVGLTRNVESETRNVDSAFKNLSIGIAGYLSVNALKNFAMELINIRGEFQKTEIAYSTMLGSSEKAKNLMGQMVELAQKTPFSFSEVATGAKQLLAFQVPANQVVDTLTRMGNIASGLGVPISRLNLVYGQVMAKGRLMGDDLRQFTEAGIPMVAELAKKFNTTSAAVTDMVSAGKIGFKDVQDVLFNLTNEGGMFFNLMEKQSASLSGKVANLGDNWEQMFNKIGEANEGILYGGIEGLNYLVENYQEVLNTIEALVIAYGSYKAAVIVASSVQTFANKTIQSEIALLSISEKMKLGRAMVTQRQAEATARDTVSELANARAKYASLQTEVSSLSIKRQQAIQSGITATAKAQEARVQLALARMELSSIQATGTAREIEIAQKRVTTAQNTVIATQETAAIARKRALAAATQFNTTKQQLENTAQTIGVATRNVATASEAAQIAAKNANAIATARLTLVTRIRTAATQLATQAQVLLNATMLNNPIVIVIAAIAGLTYAYFRLRDTTTSLSIAEKQLNSERQKASQIIDDLKNKTQELTAIINSETATKLQQLEAYKQMQAMYPSLLKDMDVETFKKLDSTEAQKKLNAEIDKFSTKNLQGNVIATQNQIQNLTQKLERLKEALKTAGSDRGIVDIKIEQATKNLEAQKIILDKYNSELKVRLENEKISSMSLAEQKKYWEDQIVSINTQISAQEKSNSKKAESIDKLNNISSLTKTTSANLLNWNITPFLSQLDRAKNELNKINNAQSDTGVNKNKGFWEQQKKAASDANDAMSGKDIRGAAWNENIKKIREADLQLKKYDYTDRDLLKAQKERAKERLRLEKGAEKAYLEGSIKRYDQQISLLEDALSRSNGDSIQLRYVDKYGKEKNSAEVRSLKSVQDELLKLRLDRAEREKLIEVKSFQEINDEAERQWNNYYKMAEFYGKETADAQYKELFKGSANYLEYLEKQEQALKDLQATGILSPKQKEDLAFIGEKIAGLNGTVTPLENFKRDIDNTLKSLPSLVDQLEALNNFETISYEKAGGNSSYFLQQRKLIEENRQNILQQQKDTYQEFLNEQRTFEDKKSEVEKKYTLIRDQIAKNKSISDAERLRQLNASYKKEGEEISELNLEGVRKTDLWKKAFGDLSTSGVSSLKRLKKYLVDYLEANKNLPPTEVEAISNQIKNIENDLRDDPFEKISLATENYKIKLDELAKAEKKFSKDKPEFKSALEDTRLGFIGIMEAANDAAKFMINAVVTSIDAFGGISDEAKETIAEIQNLAEGVISAVKGFYSGNYGEAVTGIVQAISALSKLLNGDSDKDRYVKMWQRAVDNLKFSYQQLQYAIEQTAGEEQIAKQRELIANLKEQQKILLDMKSEENAKKSENQDKIEAYSQQIKEINQQIQQLIDDFKTSVTTTNFKDLSENIANALIEAFGKGEDAATSFEKVVDDVMRNAVANALKIKILQPAVESMVDQLYASMGYGSLSGATAEQAKLLKDMKDQIAEIDSQLPNASSFKAASLIATKKDILEKIAVLNQQIAANVVSGSFDGLTEAEREAIKATGQTAMQQYMYALDQYKELFGSASENAQGLKGDIKGITEKTAGALEAQFNALRINVVAMFQLMKQNHTVQNSQTVLLSQIEVNTRRLHSMDKTLTEMNAKMKKSLAGVP